MTPDPHDILWRMYNEYFGLADSPFSIAPNPRFLYMSERHREALAHLVYGIKSDGGFIVLTGEVGTGKTTVCRCLLAQIPEDIDTAFVLNPKQTAIELLGTVCDDFGIPYAENATIKILVDKLNDFLLNSHKNGRRTVLIIDEAQNLSIDVLEQLRLLTNLETDQRKLLQIILLGQPELLEMLERNDLRQLAQRITARFHLDALSREEVASYIRHRLDVAGSKGELFLPGAVARIYALSAGIPRLINLICDRALLGAYARDQRQVDRKIVDQAAAEIFGRRTRAASRIPRLATAGAVAAVALIVAGYLLRYHSPASLPEPTAAQASPAHAPVEVSALAKAAPPTATHDGTSTSAPDSVTTAHTSGAVTTASAQPVAAPTTDPLINIEGDDSAETAMSQLFTLWGVPLKASGESPCNQAQQFGLACMSALGSVSDLDHLNRPAVIDLDIAGIDNYVTVTRIHHGIVDVASSKGTFKLKESDLLRGWDGNFALLWKPPPAYHVVQRGDKGATVDWLFRQLAAIDGEKPAPAVDMAFDAKLEARLKRFQITEGLRPDGIAGARTWIHINSVVDKDVPRLSAGG